MVDLPLWKILVSWDYSIIPNKLWKTTNVPNHQPVRDSHGQCASCVHVWKKRKETRKQNIKLLCNLVEFSKQRPSLISFVRSLNHHENITMKTWVRSITVAAIISYFSWTHDHQKITMNSAPFFIHQTINSPFTKSHQKAPWQHVSQNHLKLFNITFHHGKTVSTW